LFEILNPILFTIDLKNKNTKYFLKTAVKTKHLIIQPVTRVKLFATIF
jgi:hypothetical protein